MDLCVALELLKLARMFLQSLLGKPQSCHLWEVTGAVEDGAWLEGVGFWKSVFFSLCLYLLPGHHDALLYLSVRTLCLTAESPWVIPGQNNRTTSNSQLPPFPSGVLSISWDSTPQVQIPSCCLLAATSLLQLWQIAKMCLFFGKIRLAQLYSLTWKYWWWGFCWVTECLLSTCKVLGLLMESPEELPQNTPSPRRKRKHSLEPPKSWGWARR